MDQQWGGKWNWGERLSIYRIGRFKIFILESQEECCVFGNFTVPVSGDQLLPQTSLICFQLIFIDLIQVKIRFIISVSSTTGRGTFGVILGNRHLRWSIGFNCYFFGINIWSAILVLVGCGKLEENKLSFG